MAAARACVGVRFRPQGRDPALGLDCVGLVMTACAGLGQAAEVPRDYALSGDGLVERAERVLAARGAARVAGSADQGDILLFEPAAGQAHLAIATEIGVIQAHLGVGRVIEGPSDPAWRVRSVWRFGAEA